MNKKTSKTVASKASEILRNNSSSKIAKRLAASALSQSSTSKKTGGEMEDLASKVVRSNKYNAQTKQLAASVLSQSIKSR